MAASSASVVQLNAFDSGVIAGKVGTIDVAGRSDREVADILTAAKLQAVQERYDLVSVALAKSIEHYRVDVKAWTDVGVLVPYAGLFDLVAARLERYVGRSDVREAGDRDWSRIESFLRSTIATNRFTTDPHIPFDAAFEQKLKILETYRRRGGIAFVKEAGDDIQGFHFSYPKTDDTAVFYEIGIAPSQRLGFLALDLIGSTMSRLRETHPALSTLTTAIYENNVDSRNLFKFIGMDEVGGRRDHYYHLWTRDLLR